MKNYTITVNGNVYDVTVEENVVIGARPEMIDDKSQWGIAVVGPEVTVSAGTVIKPKQMVAGNI